MTRKRTRMGGLYCTAHDFYAKQAKKMGYRSRAALKLLEIQAQDQLLQPGMTVVDLGAMPGGWSAVAKQKVGQRGRVVALDVKPMLPISGVECIQGDFCQASTLKQLLGRFTQCKVDVVISDMAPNLTGVRTIDQARAWELCSSAFAFAKMALESKGSFLIKVFQGPQLDSFLVATSAHFTDVRVRKPCASRGRSCEIYLVHKGFKV